MAYATRDDIERIYGGDELRSALDLARDAVLSAEDLARVDQALADGASQIDAYVGVRYTLPLPVVPAVLQSFAVDIAIYRLALRNGRPRDELRKRYEDAISFLKSVAKGDAALPGVVPGGPADSQAAGGSSGDVAFVSRPRLFDRDTEIMP